MAVFLASTDKRRKRPPGFLQVAPLPDEQRRSVFARLAALKRVDQLSARVRTARAPLILMYGDPDPDAIGAALGLAALWKRAGGHPVIRFTGEVRRYQNKLLLGWLKQPIAQASREEIDEADLVAVVDCQPGFWKEDRPRAHVIIDHHPRLPDSDGEYVDIRDGYGSTSTILTEYLTVSDTPIDRKLATALLYGLQSDTDDLQRNAGPADIRAYDLLLPRSDRNFLARLHKSQVPLDLLDYVSWGITHRVHYDDMFVVHFGAVPTPDVLVQTADLLLLTCGINWVVCAGVHDDRLIAVFRGDGHHQDVGKRAALAFAKLGSAGGHRTMGRAEVPLRGEHVDTTVELLVDNLFRRMSPRRRATLVRRLRNHLHGAGPADPAAAALEGG
jgi:nanoRNase/pAp phosphatase (c-di-AMP/oligoRNAs hydrolase)